MRIYHILRILILVLFVFVSYLIVQSCEKETRQEDEYKYKYSTEKKSNQNYHLVRFQTQWLHQAQFAGFYVAHKKGFYNSYGIDVRIQMGSPENPSPEALQNNKADIVSMFLSSALREVDKGHKIKNLAQLSQKSSLLLVAKKSSGIDRVEDINGKRVGLWVSDFREPSITFLKKNNIKCEIIPISWTTNVLAHDVVDIMNMMVYNEYDVFVNTGYRPSELTVFPLADYGVNIPEDGIYCLTDYYEKNKQLCHDFAEATLDGWMYALNHEEETLSIVLSYQKKDNLPANIPHQRWMLSRIKEATLTKPEQYGKLSESDYDFSVNTLKDNGIIKSSLNYKDFITYEFSK